MLINNKTDNNQNFFELMRDAKQVEIDTKYTARQGIFYTAMGLFSIVFELLTFKIVPINDFMSFVIGILFISLVVSFIFYTISVFQKNNYHFKNGDMSRGMKNYVICGIVIGVLLFVFYFTSSDGEAKEFISSLITPITTVFAAVLAVMGVHYTHCKQQKNIADKDRPIFIAGNKNEKIDHIISINECNNSAGIDIYLSNVTNNFGYFIGLYKVRECDIHEIGIPITYQPILPNNSYALISVLVPFPDEDLLLIFKDISNNYYYIKFAYSETNGITILELDKCDIDFLNDSIEKTREQEEKVHSKHNKTIKKVEMVDLNTNEEWAIKQRKQETKPIFVSSINGYDLILDEEGTLITDIELLEKLKKERLKISRESKTKAYMIFNNQQLVAIATYKPMNKDEFISIYGLGERKYELYGEQMIALYK